MIPPSSNQETTDLFSVSKDLSEFSRILHKWSHRVCITGFCTQHNYIEIDSCCLICQNLYLFIVE